MFTYWLPTDSFPEPTPLPAGFSADDAKRLLTAFSKALWNYFSIASTES
ncbi:hypothetical protein RU86_GL000552 [Lactococcus piscium]|uniref:Uncharacterized protein n=1 Tax=Pseudolactococcus piscium TaxID=1364 RepID=A0A2A5RX21_9LACT|nr:hypothetical protein RU86_GL000552 [Lactococcus piscium]